MRRGEVWIIAGGGFASKPRPGIIIQDDTVNIDASVTVIPLTTVPSEVGRIRVPIRVPMPDGSERHNFAQVDKITTLKKQNVSKKIGHISLPEMRAIERSLLAHLGFGSSRR